MKAKRKAGRRRQVKSRPYPQPPRSFRFFDLPVEFQTIITRWGATPKPGGGLPDVLRFLDRRSDPFKHACKDYLKDVTILDFSSIKAFKSLKHKDRTHLRHLVFKIKDDAYEFGFLNHPLTLNNNLASITVWVEGTFGEGWGKHVDPWHWNPWSDNPGARRQPARVFIGAALNSLACLASASQDKTCRFVVNLKPEDTMADKYWLDNHLNREDDFRLRTWNLARSSSGVLVNGWLVWVWEHKQCHGV